MAVAVVRMVLDTVAELVTVALAALLRIMVLPVAWVYILAPLISVLQDKDMTVVVVPMPVAALMAVVVAEVQAALAEPKQQATVVTEVLEQSVQ
jgi:hypothetical protein